MVWLRTMAERDDNTTAANSDQSSVRPVPEQLLRNQFKPGQSGNPSGRPKKKPITELYEEMLSDPDLVADLRNAIAKAIKKGNMAMVLQVKEMTDRVEGKVTQPIEADVTVNLADAIAEARKRAGR
jgi:hypothetical protein